MSTLGDVSDRAARAREARNNSLLLKWSRAGRLSKTEFAEVRHLLPADATLDGDATSDLGGRTHYRKRLIEYEKDFPVKVRQLKKYIEKGKAKEPADFPPFDQPENFLAWWIRCMDQRAPTWIVALASARKLDETSSDKGINVSDLAVELSNAASRARLFLRAADRQLDEAYQSGLDARIEIAQRRWSKALRAVKDAEQAEREERQAAGELIPKAELLPEITTLIQTSQHMRASMRRRIKARAIARGLVLTEEQLEILGSAIEIERKSEDTVFRQLAQFKSLEEIDSFQLEYAGE